MNLSSAIWFLVGAAATMVVLVTVVGFACFLALGLAHETPEQAAKRIMREATK